MACNPLVLGGFELPCDTPLFLALLAVHVPFGLACVVSGLLAMFSPKGPGRHPRWGKIYYWCLSVVFVTACALAALRWAESSYLFYLGTLSFAAATFGRTARRRRWPNWVRLHLSGMGLSYIVLLTAFYVDNGKRLPLWKELPTIAYWFLPSAIGIPLIVNALLRHPVARNPPDR